MPVIWMEARCDIGCGGNGARGCLETAQGLFAHKASTATAAFKRQGWRLMDDEWVCPVCFRATTQNKEPKP